MRSQSNYRSGQGSHVMLIEWPRSERLTPDDFEKMHIGAVILKKDPRGIKVLQLANGQILKIFQIRSYISGAYFYSYARRFCRNAERLQKLSVATVIIKQLFHFEDSTNTAVLYQSLQGETLWQLVCSNKISEKLLIQLGEFVANLHQRGIYFRSLHLGNIVLTPAGELGLIDISDMSIFHWKLGCGRRLRNFNQMLRRLQGINAVGPAGRDVFFTSYIASSQISPRCSNALTAKFAKVNSRLS